MSLVFDSEIIFLVIYPKEIIKAIVHKYVKKGMHYSAVRNT